MSCRGNDTSGMLVMGVLVICIGVLLLLSQLGFVSWAAIWHWWPMFFVFAGAGRMMSAKNGGDRAWGLGLIIIGFVLEAHEFGYIRFGLAHLWPLFIIASGIALLWRAYESRKAVVEAGIDISDPDIVTESVFGSTERIVRSKQLRGGRTSAVFGEVKLDFTQAEMEGNTAVLKVEAVFGTSEIRVPQAWQIDWRGSSVFGAFEDKTYHAVQDATVTPKVLLLTGSAVFGTIEVRN